MDNVFVRGISKEDLDAVYVFDGLSGDCVSQWIEDLSDNEESDYAYGLYDEGGLIGYCTIGYADDCPSSIAQHKDWKCDSLLLSDVYILPDWRRQGLGGFMVKEAMRQKAEKEPCSDNIYLTLLYDGLGEFYGKLGFEWVDETKEYAMVADIPGREKDPRKMRWKSKVNMAIDKAINL